MPIAHVQGETQVRGEGVTMAKTNVMTHTLVWSSSESPGDTPAHENFEKIKKSNSKTLKNGTKLLKLFKYLNFFVC